MYMEHDARLHRDVAEGELLCRLLERDALGGGYTGSTQRDIRRGCAGDLRPSDSRRGCDGEMRPSGDYREKKARAEGLQNNGGCGCDGRDGSYGCGDTDGGLFDDLFEDLACGDDNGQIGNPHPCGENGVEGRSLAMVYAPVQTWQNLYDPRMGLNRGTLFRELDMPFYGKQMNKGGNCRGC